MSRYDEWLAERAHQRAAGTLAETAWTRWLRIYGYGLAPGERPEREPDRGVVERVRPWTEADRAAYDARCLSRNRRLIGDLPPPPEPAQRTVWDDAPSIESWPADVMTERMDYVVAAVDGLAPDELLYAADVADALGITAAEADALLRLADANGLTICVMAERAGDDDAEASS